MRPIRSFHFRSLAAVLCAVSAVGLGADASKSYGQDLLEQLFGGFQEQQFRPRPSRAPARSARREWRALLHPSSDHRGRRIVARAASRRHEAAANEQAGGTRSYCVRECDGYFFPVGIYSGAADLSSHQRTCNKLCPGAKATLYVMRSGSDKIEEAAAARGGSLYSRLTAALQRRGGTGLPCSCRASQPATGPMKPIYEDFTLRPGDAVMTPNGVAIFRGGSRYPYDARDFHSLAESRDLPQRTRRMLAGLERASRQNRGGEIHRAARPLSEHRSQTGGGGLR